jgi:poly-gamma-glutamate synthesis protein (capsule biosynthesis protein)
MIAILALSTLVSVSGPISEQNWSIALGGDVMFNGIAPATRSLEAVSPVFSEADLAIVNLEIPLTNAGAPTSRKTPEMRRRKDQFILKGSPKHAAKLKLSGIDGVSLGNNHAMDYGAGGLAEMCRLLDQKGIVWTGAGQDADRASRAVLVRGSGGRSVALVSFLAFMSGSALDVCSPASKGRPGVATLRFEGEIDPRARKRIDEIVRDAKKVHPFVVVALHWGIEKETMPNPYQVQLGRTFIDAGAEMVVGHHPHVLQGAELYRNKPILYSLGNLVSSRPAMSAVIRIQYVRNQAVRLECLPIWISGGVSKPLTGTAALREVSRFGKLSQGLAARFKKKGAIQPPVSLLKFSHKASSGQSAGPSGAAP